MDNGNIGLESDAMEKVVWRLLELESEDNEERRYTPLGNPTSQLILIMPYKGTTTPLGSSEP